MKTAWFDDTYMVREDGTIWSLKRKPAMMVMLRGKKPTKSMLYRRVQLGRRREYTVHALVALAFHGPRPPGMDVCHNNGDRFDNRADNLRYATRGENVREGIRHAKGVSRNHGERHWLAKLTSDQVSEIRRRRAAGETATSLSKEFGVSISHVSGLIHGRSRTHDGPTENRA